MQGIPDGIRARIEAQKRRKLKALRAAMDADAEIDRLTAIDRAEQKTPEERRADIRRRNARGVRKTLAAIGALGLAEFLRSHRRAAVGAAMSAATAGAVAVAPGPTTDLLDIAPDEPSVVATPSPRPDAERWRAGAGKRQVRLQLTRAVELEVPSDAPSTVGPTPRTGDAAPESTPRPAATRTPHASPPGTTAPEPEPPSEPAPEPESSASEPEPEPDPLPSVTAEPPQVTVPPDDEPLLCVDVDELLGLCTDLDLPAVGGPLGGNGQ